MSGRMAYALPALACFVGASIALFPGSTALIAGLSAIPLAVLIMSHGRMDLLLGAFWSVLVAHRAFSLRGEAVSTVGAAVGTASYEVVLTLLVFGAALTLTVMRVLRHEPLFATREMRWIAVYAALAGLSLLWVPSVAYSGFWLLRLLAAVLLLDGLIGEGASASTIVTWTVVGLIPYAGLMWLAYLRDFSYTGGRLAGFWLHPGVAAIALWATATLALGCAIRSDLSGMRRSSWALVALVATSAAFISGGKAGAIGGAIGVAVLITTAPSLSGRIRAGGLVILLAGTLGWWMMGLEFGLARHMTITVEGSGLATLYGRFDLWAGALRSWSSDPLGAVLGQGFTSTRMTGIQTLSGTWSSDHAHNSLLQTALETGVTGLAAMVASLWAAARSTLETLKDEETRDMARPIAAALVALLVGSLTDNVFGGLLLPTTYLLFGLVAAASSLRTARG